jgi:cytochrome c biogenesis protein ResB
VKQIYAFFKSVRLAVVLLCILALTSIFATLVPQGREAAFYTANYSRLIANSILAFQLDAFFSSYLFIATIILFTINLAVCATSRLYREFTGRRKRRFGPDLIHVGLLILIVGGLTTFLGRREAFFYLAEGEEVRVADMYIVKLERYEFLTYENGQPKDWISTVDVIEDGNVAIDDFAIEVNRPLAIGNIDLFQSSYGERARVDIIDDRGVTRVMDMGSYFSVGSDIMLFSGVAFDPGVAGGYLAQFQHYENQRVTEVLTVAPGDKVGDYEVGAVEVREVTGLRAVSDPGYLPALIGFILCVVGLMLTYAQKIGDKEI